MVPWTKEQLKPSFIAGGIINWKNNFKNLTNITEAKHIYEYSIIHKFHSRNMLRTNGIFLYPSKIYENCHGSYL